VVVHGCPESVFCFVSAALLVCIVRDDQKRGLSRVDLQGHQTVGNSSRCRLGTTTFGKKPTEMVIFDVRRSDAPVEATSVATTDMVLRSPDRIRASPLSDARCQRPGSVARIQGLPPHGQRRLEKTTSDYFNHFYSGLVPEH